ncbi:MAG: hypothetical protein PHP92_03830 [Candidatus Nanoarchaeia archaeon]|nr:hypothetical protein [Candidatus Nanoarchaeia archaeon]
MINIEKNGENSIDKKNPKYKITFTGGYAMGTTIYLYKHHLYELQNKIKKAIKDDRSGRLEK